MATPPERNWRRNRSEGSFLHELDLLGSEGALAQEHSYPVDIDGEMGRWCGRRTPPDLEIHEPTAPRQHGHVGEGDDFGRGSSPSSSLRSPASRTVSSPVLATVSRT